MNKLVFYNELIPEDTIIKSILDYKSVSCLILFDQKISLTFFSPLKFFSITT